ncbi:MAG: DUF4349 domain-containing protein [Clostridiales bacterium]|jgi:hypothetical protein|nr:DUF4349 domain-containing protein [Clostridiales bacterium]
MLDCDKVTELIPLYIDNELSEEERAGVEGHLASCGPCKARYEEMCSLMSALYGIEDEALPEGFHDEFMEKLRGQAKPESVFTRWNYKAMARAGAYAAAAIIAVSAVSVGVSALLSFDERTAESDAGAVTQPQAKLDQPAEYAMNAAAPAPAAENAVEIVPADRAERDLAQDPIASSITYYNIELTVEDIQETMDQISRLSGTQVSMNKTAPPYDGAQGSAFITRRVSAQEFEIVKDRLRSLGSAMNESESKESRSRQLSDLRARLAAKEAEKDRLLNLLGMSGELDVLVRVESRLNSVADESDNLNAQIRDINREIGQPYLNIQIYNVAYDQPAPPKQGLGARMANSFKESVNSTVKFMQNLLLFVVSAAVPTAVCVILAALIFILVRRAVKKRRGRQQ